MMLLLKERNFERQNGKQLVYISLDILDTILLQAQILGDMCNNKRG